MNKYFNYFVTIISFIIFFLLIFLNYFNETINFNGLSVLIITCLVCIPQIRNLYCTKKVYSESKIYNIITIILFSIIILLIFPTFYLLVAKYPNGNNAAKLYLFDRLIMIEVIILINYIIFLFTKKKTLKKDLNVVNSLIIILLISILISFSALDLIGTVINIAMISLTLIIILKNNKKVCLKEYKQAYILLMIMTLVHYNFLSFLLALNLYLSTKRAELKEKHDHMLEMLGL